MVALFPFVYIARVILHYFMFYVRLMPVKSVRELNCCLGIIGVCIIPPSLLVDQTQLIRLNLGKQREITWLHVFF